MQLKRAEIEFVIQESCSSESFEDEISILDLCENQFIGEEIEYEAEEPCDTLIRNEGVLITPVDAAQRN